jgi:EmrB/QacA subfamily drug resistance transporter
MSAHRPDRTGRAAPTSGVASSAELSTSTVDEAHRRRWWTLAVLCLTLVLISVDNTILNVAIPTLARELEASASQLQWIVDSYVLVFAGLLLTAGFLGDKFGRRGALMAGMAIFGVGSIAASMAGSASELIACRALMGVGGALIMPATLSILTNVFRDPKERAKAIAIWAGCSGLGVALGPVTGGWLLEHFEWGSVFLVNLPVLVLAIVGCVLVVPSSKDVDAPKLDIGGACLSMAGLTALLWAIIEAPEQGWTSSSTLVAFVAAATVLSAFVWWESRQRHPMLNLGFFRNPRFSAASGAVTLTFFALFGSLFLVTQYMQSVMGYTALQSGIRYLPLAATLLIVSPCSAKAAARFGSKAVVGLGLATVSVGLLLMLRLGTDTGFAPLLASMLVLSAGMGLTMAPATESIMGSLPPEQAGVGSAVNDTTREVGGALGVAVLGSVLSSVFGSRMIDVLAGGGLPDEARQVAEHSVTGAVAVAAEVGGDAGRQLAAGATSAFVDGLHTTSLVAAGFAAAGALIALLFLPARAVADPDPDPDSHDVIRAALDEADPVLEPSR